MSKRILYKALSLVLLGLFMFTIIMGSVHLFMQLLISDMELYLSESACVAEYIQAGIERSAIATGDGTCWLK